LMLPRDAWRSMRPTSLACSVTRRRRDPPGAAPAPTPPLPSSSSSSSNACPSAIRCKRASIRRGRDLEAPLSARTRTGNAAKPSNALCSRACAPAPTPWVAASTTSSRQRVTARAQSD
jgi:hypothetical protein